MKHALSSAGRICNREYRAKPLIGAEPYFFCLDTKETKNQDKKILPPTGKTPRPALFVGPLPAFLRAYSKMSLRGGTTKQSRRVQYASDEVASLSLAMTGSSRQQNSFG